MKKLFSKLIILFRLWLINKMGYKLPSLREANPVKPGQLYDHFGYVVLAVPNNSKFRIGDYTEGEMPEQCLSCDLYKKGIPCSFPHRMANGSDVCDTNKFQIICKNTHNI